MFLHLNAQRYGFELFLEDSLDYYGYHPLRCALTLHRLVVRKVLHRLSASTRDLPGPKSVNWLTEVLKDTSGSQMHRTLN